MGGAVSLKNTLISNCWANQAKIADNNGGGIAIMNKASVTLDHCVIRACLAHEMGGGIYMKNDDSVLTLIDTDILSCKAKDEEGGAIHQKSGKTTWKGGSAAGCSAESDDGGAIWQNKGELYCEGVSFADNSCENLGGAVLINTDDMTWFVDCEFLRNTAGEHGGAIYLDDNHLYMEDCSMMANACKEKGGAIYLNSSGSIDMCGKMVIKGNDGTDTMDNLVMENGAWIYDQGLEAGSEVHLRSDKNGEQALAAADDLTSEYQMKKYLVADTPGGLKLTDEKTLSSKLMASAVSPGKIALILGSLIIIATGVYFYMIADKKRKGERS